MSAVGALSQLKLWQSFDASTSLESNVRSSCSQLRKEIQTFIGLFRDLLVGALPRHDPETRSAKIGVELHTLRFLRGSILLCQEVEKFTYVT